MGGFGSGKWSRSNTKPTVGNCFTLDVLRLMHGSNTLYANAIGMITFAHQQTGEVRASIGYSVLPAYDGLLLKLKYRANGEPVELPVLLTATYPHLGGERWWFKCPLVVNNVPCNRRVRKLYLRGRYFGCRHCHGLTYRSCQKAHYKERSLGIIDRLERRVAG